jgi:aminotransferase in exopolysaccharide biosynthesis
MFKHEEIIDFIRCQFPNKDVLPLHEPSFSGNEKLYVMDAINSTFVSSIGPYVDMFELMMAEVTNARKAIAVVNGTSGLQVALRLCGVQTGDEVLTQALTFIATVNAILYNGASPVFLDVDLDTMGLSPKAVKLFLDEYGEIRDGFCFNRKTNRRIAACMPMHTFGFPVHLDELISICNEWNIPIIEDAAESIGSRYKGLATGSFGRLGVFSLNGNKIVTSGGGGVIITNDLELGKKAKHLTTTAKIPHPYEYIHDEVGYNFRMPNINAALACAQLEQLNSFIQRKRELADDYFEFFKSKGIKFIKEPKNTKANYWLMSIQMENKKDRDTFLRNTNNVKVMTRPIWQLIFKSPKYCNFQRDDQRNASFLEDRIVNIPSSVRT